MCSSATKPQPTRPTLTFAMAHILSWRGHPARLARSRPIVVISLMDGSLFLVIRVDAARGPSSPSLARIAFGPLPGSDCRISDWQTVRQELSEMVGPANAGWVFFTGGGTEDRGYAV